MKKILLGVIVVSAFSSFISAQVVIEGDVEIKDNPETELVTEGSLKVNGSLVISDATPAQTYATGKNSIALGLWARAFGDGSIAMSLSGNSYYSAQAWGIHNIAIGEYSVAGTQEDPSDYNIAYGYHCHARGGYAISMGRYSLASTVYSVAIGNGANATGHISTAMGYGAKASGYMGVAFGRSAVASGESAVALGNNNTSSSRGSMALGYYSTAASVHSNTLGFQVKSTSFRETVVGSWNDPAEYSANAGLWRPNDPIFVVGNGEDENNKSNALVISKNGNAKLNGEFAAQAVTASTMKVTSAGGGIPMGNFGRPETAP